MAAPGTFHFFAAAAKIMKFDDLDAAPTLKMALCSGTTHDITATGNTILANLTQISGTNGYTTGGQSLTAEAVAADAANDGWKISTSNPSWTATAGNIVARFAVLCGDGTMFGVTDPLVGYFVLDSTGGDAVGTDVTVVSGNTLQLNCPADGWGKITSS